MAGLAPGRSVLAGIFLLVGRHGEVPLVCRDGPCPCPAPVLSARPGWCSVLLWGASAGCSVLCLSLQAGDLAVTRAPHPFLLLDSQEGLTCVL